MIRVVTVLSLLVLLVLVLYVPSAHPPERFLAQLRAEHEAATAYWGAEPATRMLDRAMSMQDATAQVTPIPAAKDAPSSAGVNGAVSREMSSVNQRLFNNAYFRAVDALLLLASYRLSTLLEWLPWLAAFVLAALVDGGFARLIKAKDQVFQMRGRRRHASGQRTQGGSDEFRPFFSFARPQQRQRGAFD